MAEQKAPYEAPSVEEIDTAGFPINTEPGAAASAG
jgi:hypothetical protein